MSLINRKTLTWMRVHATFFEKRSILKEQQFTSHFSWFYFIFPAARSEIRRTREHYLPVATRGAIIYFTLVDLPSLNVMYQFSLPWVVDLFVSCLLSVNSNRKQGLKRANSPLLGTLQAGKSDYSEIARVNGPLRC